MAPHPLRVLNCTATTLSPFHQLPASERARTAIRGIAACGHATQTAAARPLVEARGCWSFARLSALNAVLNVKRAKENETDVSLIRRRSFWKMKEFMDCCLRRDRTRRAVGACRFGAGLGIYVPYWGPVEGLLKGPPPFGIPLTAAHWHVRSSYLVCPPHLAVLKRTAAHPPLATPFFATTTILAVAHIPRRPGCC